MTEDSKSAAKGLLDTLIEREGVLFAFLREEAARRNSALLHVLEDYAENNCLLLGELKGKLEAYAKESEQ